jgi:regulator of protease activity HflC (stomatin/prohibitin superfamily)
MTDFVEQLARQAKAAAESATSMPRQLQQLPRKRAALHLAVPLRFVIFLAINAVTVWWAVERISAPPQRAMLVAGGVVLSIVLIRIVHVAAQWERGIVLRLGKFQSVRGPGVILIFPVIDHLKMIDTRIQTVAIPQQSVITRDNVPMSINGVLFFKVVDVMKAVVSIQDYEFSILQYAQVTLRDVMGRLALDEMLAELEQIQAQIEALVGEVARGWGLEVDGLRLQDIDMPADLKKMMSRQASAEREKRATITKAEGDKLAALNLAEAAATMLASPGAMQLRTLQTIDGLGPQPSNTVVLAVPSDLFTLAGQVTELMDKRVKAARSAGAG